ncbi:patatin-like phospholipase family protein [Baekduia sp.]|jgi:NTE family protein|uniref:patatin-like phospholipase family protein n=1 Tax=Baekduia sp. TaxID=2600305 RepID=UPI002E094E9D|nr:patatin-like phospholipase family protein [Baekduia sp.]
MPPSALLRPDVLVLAGGGIVGEAWMHGVLAGIEDAAGADFRKVEAYVGTSAGSIVAARLAAGRRPPRPDATAEEDAATWSAEGQAAETDEPTGLHGLVRDAARVGWAVSEPLTSAAVTATAPVGALARAAILSRAASHGRPLQQLHTRVTRWGARFDGRLRICTVDRRSGRRTVFGAPGAPAASVADAVCASCAIPWVFAPVRIGDREYVDGGAWSTTNLDAAQTGRDTHVLCLDPAASLGGRDRRAVAVRSAFRVASELELQSLRRRGAQVAHVAPDDGASTAMGPNLMAPSRTAGALSAGYAQGRRLAAQS